MFPPCADTQSKNRGASFFTLDANKRRRNKTLKIFKPVTHHKRQVQIARREKCGVNWHIIGIVGETQFDVKIFAIVARVHLHGGSKFRVERGRSPRVAFVNVQRHACTRENER